MEEEWPEVGCPALHIAGGGGFFVLGSKTTKEVVFGAPRLQRCNKRKEGVAEEVDGCSR